jgi:hypothetical protein
MDMSRKSFYQTWNIVNEAGAPPPVGGPPPGGPPGGDPLGGLGGGAPPMGGPPGGDPMGGGAPGAGGQPVPVESIPVADAWKILEKIAKDQKYGKFFEEISINKPKKSEVFTKKKEEKKEKKKSSLMK